MTIEEQYRALLARHARGRSGKTLHRTRFQARSVTDGRIVGMWQTEEGGAPTWPYTMRFIQF